jgi:hypothetical protein
MRHGTNYPSYIHDHIHPCIKKEEEEEEATLARYTTSHMKTEHEDKKAPNMIEQIPLVQLITLQIIGKS